MTPNDPPTPAPAATRRTPKNPAAATEVDRLERRLRPPTAPWRPKTGLPGLLFAALLPVALVLAGFAGFAAIASEPGSTPYPPSTLELERLHVEARLTDSLAVTTVRADYTNPEPEQAVEARMQFPFPETGVLTEFTLTTTNDTYIGIVTERTQARQSYQDAVSRDEHAVLLESAGQGRLALRVNVGAGESVTLEMTYAEVLPMVGGIQDYAFPLDEITGPATIDSLVFDIEAHATHGWTTPPHASGLGFETIAEEHGAVHYRHESTQANPQEPVIVQLWPDADGFVSSAAVSAYEANAAAVFQILPPTHGAEALPMDLVLLVDVSGSMNRDDKMGQARDALHFILDELREQDRFALAKFSTDVDWQKTTLQTPTEDILADAHDWVAGLGAGGWTNISGSLYDAFGVLENAGHGEGTETDRLPVIVLITDGMPNRWISQPPAIVDAVGQWNTFDARVHTVGIGFGHDNAFLGTLAEANRGIYRAMTWQTDAAEALQDFYNEIGTPVLRDVTLHFPTLDIRELHPMPLRDVYAGSHLVAAARIDAQDLPADIPYEIHGTTTTGTINITGTIPASEIQLVPEAEKLWARQKAASLERQLGLGNQDARGTLTEHGLHYQIATATTSWLIVPEDELDAIQEKIEARLQQSPQHGDVAGGSPGNGPAGAPGGGSIPTPTEPADPVAAYEHADPAYQDTPAAWDSDTDEEATPALPIMVLLVALGTVMAMTRRRNVR